MDPSSTNPGEFTPNSTSMISSGGIKSRGTRSIMEGLRDILGGEIVDVKPVEVSPNSIVNARIKKEINAQDENSIDNDDSMDLGYIIEDDILE